MEKRKFLLPLGLEMQPIASHHTDPAIPVLKHPVLDLISEKNRPV
jgi:hypothetical protein